MATPKRLDLGYVLLYDVDSARFLELFEEFSFRYQKVSSISDAQELIYQEKVVLGLFNIHLSKNDLSTFLNFIGQHREKRLIPLIGLSDGTNDVCEENLFQYEIINFNSGDNYVLKRVQFYLEMLKYNSVLGAEIRELQHQANELYNFSSVAVHDLKSPLGIIQGFTDLVLMDENISEESKSFLQKVIDSSIQMNLLIQDLMNFSHIHTHDLIFGQVNLNRMVTELLSELSSEVAESHAKVDVSIDDEIILESDKELFTIVIKEIIENSLKFISDDSSPKIHIKAQVLSDKRKMLVGGDASICLIEIKDHGIGFENDKREDIFEAFMRLNPKKDFVGFGLGLTMARKICTRLGGTLTAIGDKGVGATFYATLPIKQTDRLEWDCLLD